MFKIPPIRIPIEIATEGLTKGLSTVAHKIGSFSKRTGQIGQGLKGAPRRGIH